MPRKQNSTLNGCDEYNKDIQSAPQSERYCGFNFMTKLTKQQAAIIGAYTGILCGKFSDMHEYIEKKMNRPVFTHEMGNKETYELIQQSVKSDFLDICHE